MFNILKTELDIQVLKDCAIALTAKQRQLLILINTHDLDPLNVQLMQKLATSEVLSKLIEKGLVEDRNHQVQRVQKIKLKSRRTSN